MLKKIRISFATLFFVCITLLFLDFTGAIHTWLGWMAKMQFLPAVLALNFGVILLLVVITLFFGRIYCSAICPLGVFQDVVSWLSGKRKKKKYRFSYSPAVSWLRYGMLSVFVVALIAGIDSFVALLAPYSSYGRIAANLFVPVWQWGNNLLAFFSARADSYVFYETEVWIKGLPTMAIAIVTFVSLVWLSWKHGRTYCNTICPVGTVLGFISRFSLFRSFIDTEKCNKCMLCARQCKAACIDSKVSEIDYSRCVSCMNCISVCKRDAISFRSRFKRKSTLPEDKQSVSKTQIDDARRIFLSTTVLVAATSVVKAQEVKMDGGLATIENQEIPDRATRIVPFGALGIRNFEKHCTACQLCVSVCPSQVLRPSGSLMNLMQPEMSYERGYCRPECVKCSDVCPAGAILPITKADKSSIQIGHAVWIKKNCIPLKDNQDCGNCARHCPAKAIEMIPSESNDETSRKVPVINVERCIGCGACENLCPSRPFSAIYVEGHQRHRII